MVFLILESLGSTELMFILVMALVFFGPRKLPQLSRTLGKNLASFRRASEEFKNTWEKEVHLEELNLAQIDLESNLPERSILEANGSSMQSPAGTPMVEPATADLAVPREPEALDLTGEGYVTDARSTEPEEPSSKRDWL